MFRVIHKEPFVDVEGVRQLQATIEAVEGTSRRPTGYMSANPTHQAQQVKPFCMGIDLRWSRGDTRASEEIVLASRSFPPPPQKCRKNASSLLHRPEILVQPIQCLLDEFVPRNGMPRFVNQVLLLLFFRPQQTVKRFLVRYHREEKVVPSVQHQRRLLYPGQKVDDLHFGQRSLEIPSP